MKDLESPNAGEIDALAVLWESPEPLGLSSVWEGVVERRTKRGAAAPAPTTVSTYLRSLKAKGLITQVSAAAPVGTASSGGGALRTRGATRKGPLYRCVYDPISVLRPTLAALAAAFPEEHRALALEEFARLLELRE
ncbi:MAG: hypothetical protein AAF384_19405 [Pseudomonadota bacterium]